MFSPLEGVKDEILIGFILGKLDLSFTSLSFFLIVVYSAVFLLFLFFRSELKVIPHPGQLVLESFYRFMLDMIVGRAGPESIVYFPMMFCIFVFVLFGNLCGIFPYGMTVTAQIGMVFMLGYSSFIGLTYIGLGRYKWRFLKKFVVGGGMAKVLVALLFVLEIVSYCVRPLSLSVRLAANMIGGHALLHLLAMMFIQFVGKIFGAVGCWCMSVGVLGVACFVSGVFAVFMLEVGVAFLQAYIFSLLLCLYIGESIRPV